MAASPPGLSLQWSVDRRAQQALRQQCAGMSIRSGWVGMDAATDDQPLPWAS